MNAVCARCGSALLPGQGRCDACGEAVVVSAAGSRPVQRRALMTELASQAMGLSDTFNLMFEERFVGLRLTLAKPGMSTAGGKQSIQHIVLSGPGGASLVIGSVDTGAGRAELRGLERLRTVYRNRFGSDLPVSPRDWQDFADRAEEFLREEGLVLAQNVDGGVGASSDWGASVPEAARAGRGVPIWVAIVLALVLAGVAVAVTALVLHPVAPPAVLPPAWAPSSPGVSPPAFPAPALPAPPGAPPGAAPP